MKNSWCTGERGKQAKEEVAREMENRIKALEDKEKKKKEEADQRGRARGESAKDEQRTGMPSDRKRSYDFINAQAGITDQDLEAYRLKRHRAEDPMRDYLKKDSAVS